MVTNQSINNFPELVAFLRTDNASELQTIFKRLKFRYLLQPITDNRIAYRENPNVARYFSPLDITSMFGMLLHINAILSSSNDSYDGDFASYLSPNDWCKALCCASFNGHLPVVKRLLEFESAQLGLSLHDNAAINDAASGNHLDIANLLLENNFVKKNINVSSNSILLSSVLNGHEQIVARLLQEPLVITTLASSAFTLFTGAKRRQHTNIVTQLLLCADVFKVIDELADIAYLPDIQHIILYKLDEFKLRLGALLGSSSESSLFLNNDDARLCFYILKHLIQNPVTQEQPELKFLLTNPTIKLLAHTNITPNEQIELLQLALHVNNIMAESILIRLPTINNIANQHAFYGNSGAMIRHQEREMRGHAGLICLYILYKHDYHALEILHHVLPYLLPSNSQKISTRLSFFNTAKQILKNARPSSQIVQQDNNNNSSALTEKSSLTTNPRSGSM